MQYTFIGSPIAKGAKGALGNSLSGSYAYLDIKKVLSLHEAVILFAVVIMNTLVFLNTTAI